MKTNKEILKMVDHTKLSVDTTFSDIEKLINQAITNDCASVCIPPCYVKQAAKYAKNKCKELGKKNVLPICTVIGFPNGNTATKIKCKEAEKAIKDGATEIDMVINIGWLKAKKYDEVANEIIKLVNICHFDRPKDKQVILKVIIESCLLSEFEINKMCEIVAMTGADFIKTSTGFSTGGATFEVIALMKKNMDFLNEKFKNDFPYRDKIKIKAAGGIKNFEDAKKFVELGADRLGTSRLIK